MLRKVGVAANGVCVSGESVASMSVLRRVVAPLIPPQASHAEWEVK